MERCSEAIGSFTRGLKLDGIPPDVSEKAKLIFLDRTLGDLLTSD